MIAKHVLYIRTLLRNLQTGIENSNALIMSLSRLLRTNLASFMRVSTVQLFTDAYICFLQRHLAEGLSVEAS